MKYFILKTINFIGVSIITLSIIFIYTNSAIDQNADFSIANPVNNIIIGHSHSECAFNDSLINNFKNLSQSRESYLYSLVKVKKIVSQNKNVKNIFLEFSNNQIPITADDWIWDDVAISSRTSFLPFLDQNDNDLLINKNPKSFIAGSSKSFRNNIINLLISNYDYTDKIGGYRWLKRNKTDSLIAHTKTNNVVNSEKQFELSIQNITYLEKIISFCKEKKINIYFIRSPQHVYYEHRLNEKEFNKIRHEKFKDIAFLDFNDFPLSNKEFGDFGHLNHKGAKKFSLWFNNLLKKGLLSKTNKNEFVSVEIDKINRSLD